MWIEILIFVLQMELIQVIPHVGMWIEISALKSEMKELIVIPHVGMWIEIANGIENHPYI